MPTVTRPPSAGTKSTPSAYQALSGRPSTRVWRRSTACVTWPQAPQQWLVITKHTCPATGDAGSRCIAFMADVAAAVRVPPSTRTNLGGNVACWGRVGGGGDGGGDSEGGDAESGGAPPGRAQPHRLFHDNIGDFFDRLGGVLWVGGRGRCTPSARSLRGVRAPHLLLSPIPPVDGLEAVHRGTGRAHARLAAPGLVDRREAAAGCTCESGRERGASQGPPHLIVTTSSLPRTALPGASDPRSSGPRRRSPSENAST